MVRLKAPDPARTILSNGNLNIMALTPTTVITDKICFYLAKAAKRETNMNMAKATGILFFSAATIVAGEWMVLFDGTTLDGWKASETPGCFMIIDNGVLKVEGGRSHLFWMGKDDIPGAFTNFEFSAKVKTTAGANSGIFFHTKYQETGWPAQGYEAQVNSTHKNGNRTGSIFDVKNITEYSPSTDDQWFDYFIRVEGKTVTISIDGKVVNEYTEPDNLAPEEKFKDRRLGSGTFAIQGHDPESIVYFRDIKVRLID